MTGLLLVFIHFVCPLVFFTNFTRNPYQTQITLLHLCVLTLLLFWAWRSLLDSQKTRQTQAGDGAWPWPLLMPLGIFTLICWISWLTSWWAHPLFFRKPIMAEGLRINLFWLVNAIGPFLIGIVMGRLLRVGQKFVFDLDWPTFAGAAFFVFGWIFYHKFRIPNPPPTSQSVLAFLWDPYAFFLWASMLAWLCWRWRAAGVSVFLSISYAVGALASVYGAGQYFGWDAVWSQMMNPYGARAISTFGNPNFLSPYLAAFMPIFVAGLCASSKLSHVCAYAVLFLIYEAGLFSTLTRSSWLGAVVGIAWVAFYCFRKFSTWQKRRVLIGLGVVGVLLFFLWPRGAGGITPKPVGRLLEGSKVLLKKTDETKRVYGPATQRLLIWSACWKFLKERPLLGKGWGLLELFYPFYQGEMLYYPDFESFRTHANNGHNEVIEIWTQTGFLGMGAMLWFFVLLLGLPLKNLKLIKEEEGLSLLSVGLIGSILAYVVDNILNVSLHFAVPGYIFWWLAGLLSAFVFIPESRFLMFAPLRHFFNRKWARWGAGLALTGLVLFMGNHFIRQWLGEFYYFRGFVLHRDQKLDLALQRLHRSHRIFPYEVNRNYEIGNVYARLNNEEKALWAYEQALAANVGYDEIYFNRAMILAKQGKRQEALREYLLSLLINPTNRLTYSGVTSLFLQDVKGHAKDAQRILSRAEHFFPNDAEILNNLGSFYSQDEQHQKAVRYFLKTVKVNPGHEHAVRNLALEVSRLIRSGERAAAKEILLQWLQITPTLKLPPEFARVL